MGARACGAGQIAVAVRLSSLLRAKREPEKHPLLSRRGNRRVAAPSVCFATARILLAAAPTAPPCIRRRRRSSLWRIFLCFSHLRLRRRFHASAGHYRQQRGNTSCEAANRRNEKKALSAATSFFPFRHLLRGLKGASSPFLVPPAPRKYRVLFWFSFGTQKRT